MHKKLILLIILLIANLLLSSCRISTKIKKDTLYEEEYDLSNLRLDTEEKSDKITKDEALVYALEFIEYNLDRKLYLNELKIECIYEDKDLLKDYKNISEQDLIDLELGFYSIKFELPKVDERFSFFINAKDGRISDYNHSLQASEPSDKENLSVEVLNEIALDFIDKNNINQIEEPKIIDTVNNYMYTLIIEDDKNLGIFTIIYLNKKTGEIVSFYTIYEELNKKDIP
ncbi:hypothetical protein [Vallitalea sp.]|jgi:hypothetical protein|uniref:hypothetical protein n=1 Tax=Vallitalea sp. TaxID=1882829 RepID=UPI0025E9DF87|nr:hypothetical protein [Vallitalea sp.]MCT4688188.1 hypothetical protein [Vallitalea sp.]